MDIFNYVHILDGLLPAGWEDYLEFRFSNHFFQWWVSQVTSGKVHF